MKAAWHRQLNFAAIRRAFLLGGLASCMAGCQGLNPLPSKADLSDYTPKRSFAEQTASEMIVRGQSPAATGQGGFGQGQQEDAGSTNYFRQPMRPSGAMPNAVQGSPVSNGNGVPASPSQYTATPYTTAQYTAPPSTVNPYGQPVAPNAQQGYTAPSGSVSGVLPPTGIAPQNSLPAPGNAYSGPVSVYPPGSTVPYNGAAVQASPYGSDFIDPSLGVSSPIVPRYQPRERVAPIDVWLQEARTGRVMLGGSVNSDLGVAGQFVVEERNFDLFRPPTSWDDIWSGRAWRGSGQNFRLELMPGNRVDRYTVNWTERNLFGYLPVSLSVGGFFFTRRYRDWDEQRLGARVALGYELTPDLSISTELRAEQVKIFDPRVLGVPELDAVLGASELYTGRVRLAHDTRDNPFLATEGHLLELIYDQVFGTYDYPRAQVNHSQYFLVRERADGSGRHVLAHSLRVGFSGSQTPIFENFFAGGYSTMRGFSFRGASPVVSDVIVGGQFQLLGSLEYVFPITADDMLRGIAFVDYGTVEQNIEINADNFRVSPGLGLRVMVPALGPAPLAFDFAVPVAQADTDRKQIFSFFMGFTR